MSATYERQRQRPFRNRRRLTKLQVLQTEWRLHNFFSASHPIGGNIGLINHNAAAFANAADAVVPKRRLAAKLINQAHRNAELSGSLPWGQHVFLCGKTGRSREGSIRNACSQPSSIKTHLDQTRARNQPLFGFHAVILSFLRGQIWGQFKNLPTKCCRKKSLQLGLTVGFRIGRNSLIFR